MVFLLRELDGIREVETMQFADGMPIACLVADWERDREWVEDASGAECSSGSRGGIEV